MTAVEFFELYETHLLGPERLPPRAAYHRSEIEFKVLFGCRKYVNYATFRAALSRFRRRRRLMMRRSVDVVQICTK